MVAWLGRLLGRGQAAELPGEVVETAPMQSWSASELPALPADRRFSVWDKLAGDSGAQALRAEWEARWDQF